MTDPIRLLLVDDEAGLLMTLAANLELEEFEVVEAASGREALELVEQGLAVDVVLSDVRMPGVSGVQLAHRLRQLRPGLPVVLMTAYADQDDLDRALAGGVFTVLSKPFDIGSAASTLRRAFARPAVLVVDDQRTEANTLAAALESSGLAVLTVFDGHAALRTVEEVDVDVCVTDLKMPGMDGAEVVQRLRAKGARVQCIVFSGHDVPEMMSRAAGSGVVACLRKPLDVHRLISAIAEARSHASESPSPDGRQRRV